MLPVPRIWWDGEGEGGSLVLVPGLMGIGVMVSVLMLIADAMTRLVPVSTRRRALLMECRVRGRESDMRAVRTGEPPRPVVAVRVPRGRVAALLLAALAGSAAFLSVVVGLAISSRVGDDRRTWALGLGVVAATVLASLGLAWLSAAVAGRAMPRWLRRLHQSWPLGTYPDPGRSSDPLMFEG
ncbi:MAG: hypothetical protein ACE5KX_04790 [Acidimicrobiia bacterium]